MYREECLDLVDGLGIEKEFEGRGGVRVGKEVMVFG